MKRLRFGLVWVVSFAIEGIFQADAFAGEVKGGGLSLCDRWLTRTLDTVESSTMLRRRDIIIVATASSCLGVSEALKVAAKSYEKTTSEKMKAQLLVNGAAAVLKANCAGCSVADPLAGAGQLVAECPLPGPGEKAHPEVLGRMRAADYVFLNALMTDLVAAGEYTETSHRMMLQFILSSAQLEDIRTSKRHKKR